MSDQKCGGLGMITTDYTVWCLHCSQWMTSDVTCRTKADAALYFVLNNWRKWERAWLCPECTKKMKESRKVK